MAGTGEEYKSASHHLYPKLILASIAALGEAHSTKSEISQYIEKTFRENLSDNHTEVLSETLEKMMEDGEILLDKNHYLKSNTSAAPRRGRGRPPKPKQQPPPGFVPPTPRPRGRPPKPRDPLSASIAKAAAGLPSRRGRPPAKHRPAVGGFPAGTKTGGGKPAVVGGKRGRGRPPKLRAPGTDIAVE